MTLENIPEHSLDLSRKVWWLWAGTLYVSLCLTWGLHILRALIFTACLIAINKTIQNIIWESLAYSNKSNHSRDAFRGAHQLSGPLSQLTSLI